MEAGKKAAASVLEVRKAVREYLLEKRGEFLTTAQVAFETGFSDKEDWVFKILENLAVNEPQTFDREIGQLSLETRFQLSNQTFAGFFGGSGLTARLGWRRLGCKECGPPQVISVPQGKRAVGLRSPC